ncbi:MAG: hypothetical protein H6545_06700 [Bacteroidales bacterium]|jgi:hypothetical protein|nr:hypothetical protein [Bacteroidales bacterium]MCB9028784.1 hypothetical protein [Bacteroidales bacterium]MDD3737025.1 hypothetical protein [Bacteroidales bacterium]HNT93528.1 hypothetical protein [Bacteroidales bacterium]HOO66125.1 hypothetical protein [Bacteroidales bacterium]
MRKPLLITLIILAVLLLIPAVSFIRWAFQEKKPIDVVILDKTVPTLDRLGHRSFIYTLTNARFVKGDKGGSYSASKDYYGFEPLRPVREKQFRKKDFRLTELIDLAENNDALYYTDTYGVFFNDWYQGIKKTRRSRKLYGGLNNNDYLLMVEMKRRDKLVILEYNTFDYPTAPLEKFKTEELLGITSTGWTGQYYRSLDTLSQHGAPAWMPAQYRKQYREPWTFTNAGVVLLNEHSIIVLEEGKHLASAMPMIKTSSTHAERFSLPATVAFTNSFDIIDAGSNNVLSEFVLNTTPAGDTLLFANELAPVFPAVIQEPLVQRTYYFSGDFANNDIPFWTAKLKNIQKGAKTLLHSDNENDPKRFFWLYYKPLITSIFGEYYADKAGK